MWTLSRRVAESKPIAPGPIAPLSLSRTFIAIPCAPPCGCKVEPQIGNVRHRVQADAHHKSPTKSSPDRLSRNNAPVHWNRSRERSRLHSEFLTTQPSSPSHVRHSAVECEMEPEIDNVRHRVQRDAHHKSPTKSIRKSIHESIKLDPQIDTNRSQIASGSQNRPRGMLRKKNMPELEF